jgi:hypothetical protein
MLSIILRSNHQHAGQLALAASLTLLLAVVSTAQAQLSVSCPPDLTVPNDPGVCSAVVEFPNPIVTGTNTTDVVTITPPSGSTFPVGTNEVIVAVTNGGTNLADCSFLIIVEDTEPPAINDLSLSKTRLWPPNHKLINVTVRYESVDNCGSPVDCALTVTSNEPDNGKGDGNTTADWNVVDAHHVQLRAERSGTGTGRSYTITVTCTDASGNSATADVTIAVPHDRGKHLGLLGNNNGSDNGNGHGHGHGHGP